MSGYRFRAIALLLLPVLSLLICQAGAQYWFQSGAQGGYQTEYNHGGSAVIQTVSVPSPPTVGSLGYWVGETLSNGAFIQIGYEIPNITGQYPQSCDSAGCTGSVTLTAGQPTWFWEYFPPDVSGSGSFYGEIGGPGSVGSAGALNTYAFNSTGSTWNLYLNGEKIGSVNLGASNSGPNGILAIGEYADADTNRYGMPVAQFKDLSTYDGTSYALVPQAFSFVGYGAGSAKALQSTYGVEEINNSINFFQVGSGLSLLDNIQLWGLGNHLAVQSEYQFPAIAQSGNYVAYSNVNITAPSSIQIGNGERAYFVSWTGTGPGSYSGASPTAHVTMDGSVTEVANWQTQYYVNVTSQYGSTAGSGWYNSGAAASVSVSANVFYVNQSSRLVFEGWSDGLHATNISFAVGAPVNVSAAWAQQYLVNATTQYSTVTGNGWYDSGSTATVSVSSPIIYQNPEARLSFVAWSSGQNTSTIAEPVNGPLSPEALFGQQYLVQLSAENAYGQQIQATYFELNGVRYNASAFLLVNRTYHVSNAYYKGTLMVANTIIPKVMAPTSANVSLEVYNATFSARSLIGTPLNASYSITLWNGTKASGYTGRYGVVTFTDVPYGYAYGALQFQGTNRTVLLSSGEPETVVFLDTDTIAFILILLVASVIIGVEVHRIRKARKERETRRKVIV